MKSASKQEADPVSSHDSDSKDNAEPTESRHVLRRTLFQLFCLAWLIPILYMLVRNWSTWILGASAFCPDGKCWADIFDLNTANVFKTARKLNKNSHDLIGALQFAAKALEVWFIIIASSLVFLYTMMLAEKKEGLPLGYITWPNEFSDLPSIFDKSLWSTAFSERNRGSRLTRRLQIFVALTVSICILCNVMGPAIAVLIIPSLQWIRTPNTGDQVFDQMMSSAPPDPTALISNIAGQYNSQPCSTAQITAGNYSCTEAAFGQSLDAIVGNYLDSLLARGSGSNYGLVQESGLSTVLFNWTGSVLSEPSALWTSSRQTLRQLSDDWQVVARISWGNDTDTIKNIYPRYDVEDFEVYNKSLEMRIQRTGPMLGVRPNGWPAVRDPTKVWTTQVEANRAIRCYTGFGLYHEGKRGPIGTKCMQLGTGWSPLNKRVDFSLSAVHEPISGDRLSGLDISVYSSDRVAYFLGEDLPSWLPNACLSGKANGNVPDGTDCNWDRFWSLDTEQLRNRTRHVNTWEFYRPNETTPFSATDFVAYVGFSLYQLDPAPATNPLGLVQTFNVPETGTAFPVDPRWSALAWSADVNGSPVPSNRTAPQKFVTSLAQNDIFTVGSIVSITTLHMLTLLPYSSIPSSAATIDLEHPLLARNGTVFVYAFNLSSRTSKFAVVVVIIGSIVVLAHLALSLAYYRPSKPIAEVMVAALEHDPQGEFDHANSGFEAVKTRFNVVHHSNGVGELRFRKQH